MTTRNPVPDAVRSAYAHAAQKLASEGHSLDGMCLEASVLMHKFLRERGYKAKLIRRAIDSERYSLENGHWTVDYKGIEYDPTIGHAAWGEAYKQVPRGDLYVVDPSAPHHLWPKTRTNVRAAYEIAFEPYDRAEDE